MPAHFSVTFFGLIAAGIPYAQAQEVRPERSPRILAIAIFAAAFFLGVCQNIAHSMPLRTISEALETAIARVSTKYDAAELKLEFIDATYAGVSRRWDLQLRKDEAILRLRVDAEGEVKPDGSDDAYGRQRNRRVEVRF